MLKGTKNLTTRTHSQSFYGIIIAGFWTFMFSAASIRGARHGFSCTFNRILLKGFKLPTASPDVAAILRMRTAAQPHQTAIAV
ncbi:hypothetical protein L195_g052545 [Trifolium pratense]|uniref:Uncharacterized protein n=1 Tax=Trifolium pratense TaxID=57577 RepID=A0A2K3K5N5_TRIPR|nr:hypothetical protein L195_g052545 [Trifolium pratense]